MEIDYLVETEYGENNERRSRSQQWIIAQDKSESHIQLITVLQRHDMVKQLYSNQKYSFIKSICWLWAVSAFPIFMTLSSIIFLSLCFLSCKMGLTATPYDEAYQLILCACAEYECLGRWVLPYILRADFCHNHNVFCNIKYGKKLSHLRVCIYFDPHWNGVDINIVTTPNIKNGFSLVKLVGMSQWVLMMAFH